MNPPNPLNRLSTNYLYPSARSLGSVWAGLGLGLTLGLGPLALAQDPAFTTEPGDVSASVGGTASFTVSGKATDPYWVQWYYTDGEQHVPLSGTNRLGRGATLTISEVQPEQALGGYYAVITNDLGSVTSRVARIHLRPAFTRITEGPHVTDLGNSDRISWGDVNNDGKADLLVGHWPGYTVDGKNTLYVNRGNGSFVRVTEGLPSVSDGYAVGPWGDLDNDGFLDYVAIGVDRGPSIIAYGNGDGTFTQVEFESVALTPWNVCLVDYDHDGFLDLYFSNGNHLYRGLGDRKFQRMTTAEVGQAVLRSTFGPSAWADFGDDGWPDVYLGHNIESYTQQVFRSDGAGGFLGVDAFPMGGSGGFVGAWGDYDNDGYIDLAVGWIWSGNVRVYRNLGNGQFAETFTFPAPLCNWVGWADIDNDGFLDVSANSHDTGGKIFFNLGDGTFSPLSSGGILTDRPSTRSGQGCLWYDYNNDGFLDFSVTTFRDDWWISTPLYLFETVPNDNHWLKVRLIGTASNREGVGAKVRAQATYAGEARWQRRDISGGDLFNGHATLAHFGLGDAEQVDVLRIEWPSGIVQELTDLEPNQMLTVVETQNAPPTQLPQVTDVSTADGLRLVVECPTEPMAGVRCVLEASDDLVRWTKVQVRVNETGTMEFSDPHAANHPSRFYRVVVP
jgi:enediyne biosynthesis protein E4